MCGVKHTDLDKWIVETPLRKGTLFEVSPAPAGADLLLSSNTDEILNEVISIILQRWGAYCYSLEGESLEAVVGRLLVEKDMRIAVAESCTGGRIASRMTRFPGSSRYFESACVTYSNRSKERLLSVSGELLKKKGAVSAEVASAMSEGVRLNAGVDLGLAVTGIAGPGGGSAQKPVGRVYITLSDEKQIGSFVFRFDGDRESIQSSAAQMAIEQVRRYLLETGSSEVKGDVRWHK